MQSKLEFLIYCNISVIPSSGPPQALRNVIELGVTVQCVLSYCSTLPLPLTVWGFWVAGERGKKLW